MKSKCFVSLIAFLASTACASDPPKEGSQAEASLTDVAGDLPGSACLQGRNCASGLCYNTGIHRVCVAACETDEQCPPDARCDEVDILGSERKGYCRPAAGRLNRHRIQPTDSLPIVAGVPLAEEITAEVRNER